MFYPHTGTPPIDIIWVHNNKEIPLKDPLYQQVSNGNEHRLILAEVFPEDAGSYVCEAYNDYGDTDTFCNLTIVGMCDACKVGGGLSSCMVSHVTDTWLQNLKELPPNGLFFPARVLSEYCL